MNRMMRFATVAAIAASISPAVSAATMLAVPARHNLVNLGFDILEVVKTDFAIACYKGEDAIESLEVFDADGGQWLSILPERWESLGLLGYDKVVVAGSSKAANDLLALSTWAKQSVQPTDRAYLDIALAVHAMRPISSSQWKALSNIYGFTIKEVKMPSRFESRRPPTASTTTPQAKPEPLPCQPAEAKPVAEKPAAPAQAGITFTKREQPVAKEPAPVPAPKAESATPVAPKATDEGLVLPTPFGGKSALDEMPAATEEAKRLTEAEAAAQKAQAEVEAAKAKAEEEAKKAAAAAKEAELKAKAEEEARKAAEAAAAKEAELKAKVEAEAAAKAKAEEEAKKAAEAAAAKEAELKAKAEAEAAAAKARAEEEAKKAAEAAAAKEAELKAKAEEEAAAAKAKAEEEEKKAAEAAAAKEAELKAKAEEKASDALPATNVPLVINQQTPAPTPPTIANETIKVPTIDHGEAGTSSTKPAPALPVVDPPKLKVPELDAGN